MSIQLNMPFEFHPREGLICAGQPSPEQFRSAAQQGLKAVLNMRPDAEMEFDEAALMAELGIAYENIPVAGGLDINPENVARLRAFLQAHAGSPVMVHCASSNRVGALMALAEKAGGASDEEALAFGRACGLTKLEPMVQGILANA